MPLPEALSVCGKNEECFFTTKVVANGELIAPDNFLFLSSLNENIYPETTVKVREPPENNGICSIMQFC